MAENGDNILKVVNLFVDNINESTKVTAKVLEQIDDRVEDLNTKMSTPPRHEELDKSHEDMNKLLTLTNSKLDDIEDVVKSGIRTIKIVAGVFSIAILIAVSVVTYYNSKQTDTPRDSVIVELAMEKRLDILENILIDKYEKRNKNNGKAENKDGTH